MRTTTPYLCPWEYFKKEKKSFGFVYQVVASLGKPFRILSFKGPFKGSAADVSIFRSTMLSLLIEGEKVMADRGYWQEEKCWCPPTGKWNKMSTDKKYKSREVTRIRHLNERVIGRLTFWGCFKRVWHGSWKMHKLCAHVSARLTQLELYVYPLN